MNLYAIRNKEGKYFRAKGLNGYGNNWVDSLDKAKVYTRPGPAKGVISWWAANSNMEGLELVILKVTEESSEKADYSAIKEKAIKKQIKSLESQLSYYQRQQQQTKNSYTVDIANLKRELTKLKKEVK